MEALGVRWCANCLNMSTRPRIRFDERGWCNACVWAEKKKTLDWATRRHQLDAILETAGEADAPYDCLVPVSGGKDGSYVTHQLRDLLGKRVLSVTISPPLPLGLGEENLEQYVQTGVDHIRVTPDVNVLRDLNRAGLVHAGFPYFGWLVAIQAAVVRVAVNFGIPLIFYGEDGEVEYGGTGETDMDPLYDISYMKRIYLESYYDAVVAAAGVDPRDLYLFSFPSDDEIQNIGLRMTHWSYFEDWDPYRNYLVAKEHFGLREAGQSNAGTFTNFAQNDQALYALHTYLMYLKFGFGRATQDVGIEIRRGAMTREQGLNLVRLFDGAFPDEYREAYLDYYQMTPDEFDSTLGRWANRGLFRFDQTLRKWTPRFVVQ